MTPAIGYRLTVAWAAVALAVAVFRFVHELRMTAPTAAFARPTIDGAPYLARMDSNVIDSLATVVSDHDPFHLPANHQSWHTLPIGRICQVCRRFLPSRLSR